MARKKTGGFSPPRGRTERRLIREPQLKYDSGGGMRANNGLIRIAVLQALACASGLILTTPGRASADPAQFDITAQPLPGALKNFATQAKMRLLYQYDVVSHATANPVAGQLENHAALEK